MATWEKKEESKEYVSGFTQTHAQTLVSIKLLVCNMLSLKILGKSSDLETED